MTNARQDEIRELVEASLKSLEDALSKVFRHDHTEADFHQRLSSAHAWVEEALTYLDDIPVQSIPSPEDWGPEERKAA